MDGTLECESSFFAGAWFFGALFVGKFASYGIPKGLKCTVGMEFGDR